jgi:probable HAF family extracellular repeat protein
VIPNLQRLWPNAALAALLLIVSAPAVRSQSYTVRDLGTLGGSSGSAADALNASGQVVGRAFTTGNVSVHATLFSGTGSNNLDLGNLGGPANNGSEAYGINDAGQIIGYSTAPSGNLRATYFNGTGSNNTDLGTLGGNASLGSAINNAAQMVGQAQSSSGRAVLFSGTGSGNTDLGGVGGGVSGYAYAINDSGQIVGMATTAAQADRATRFSGTGSGNFDLGTLGGFHSWAYGINDAGQIVGSAQLTGNTPTHATLFSGTGSNNLDLGSLGGMHSHAYAINNAGQIVGNSHTTGQAANHAFIYSGGMMRDLNDLVVSGSGVTNIRLDSARVPGRCINDAGQIAATGDIGGTTHAILLQPVVLSAVAVSRKTQGAGTFDINLPFSGPIGIECRTDGGTNDYQIVVTFAAPVTFAGASVTSGTGSVVNSTGSGTITLTVNLTGVTNTQRIAVTLSDVGDGVNTTNIVVPMGVLLGDTNGSGGVTASDIGQTKAQSGQAVTGTNFRTDVNASGTITASDIGLVKSKSGTTLP